MLPESHSYLDDWLRIADASGFHMIERYPFPGSPGISEADVKDCLDSAEQ